MQCDYDPTQDTGGQFHCPFCGEMVVAGMPHPDWEAMEDPNWPGWDELDRINQRDEPQEEWDGDIGF